jgi:AcrR family transcriptional regulator
MECEMVDVAQPLRERLRNAAAEALLDAAEKTLIAKGYEKSTMQDIAAAAGCAVGTIYVHFKSKEEFFKAIVQRRLAEIQSVVQEALQAARNPRDLLRIFIETHVRWAHANVEFVNLACTVLPMRYYDFEARLNEIVPDCKDQMEPTILAAIGEGQQQGMIRRDIAPEILAEMLHGMMITLLDQFSARPGKFTLEQQLDMAWKFIASGLVGGASERATQNEGEGT